MTVVIRVIFRVDCGHLMVRDAMSVGMTVVAGLVGHTVVDINPRRSDNEDRQREKSKHTKPAVTHHRRN